MSQPASTDQQIRAFRERFEALRREVAKAVVGLPEAVEGVLTAAVCGGHVLLEGPPGLGKTVLVEGLAAAVDLSFHRIQFTPDLMPTDLIGTHVIMENPQGRRTFEFQQGPIFANVVLADQINRGLPKTQAALLEAMEGDAVSVSSETFHLPQPFLVMATQNPLDSEGTFPLPEPEVDRFLLKLVVPPPSESELEAIVELTTEPEPPAVRQVVDGPGLLEMRQVARGVELDAVVRRVAVGLVAATQPGHARATPMVRRYVRYGSSPRGAQALVAAAKVRAAADGRGAVSAGDLRAAAHPALRHRLMLNVEGQADEISPDRIIDELLEAVPQAGAAAR